MDINVSFLQITPNVSAIAMSTLSTSHNLVNPWVGPSFSKSTLQTNSHDLLAFLYKATSQKAFKLIL